MMKLMNTLKGRKEMMVVAFVLTLVFGVVLMVSPYAHVISIMLAGVAVEAIALGSFIVVEIVKAARDESYAEASELAAFAVNFAFYSFMIFGGLWLAVSGFAVFGVLMVGSAFILE